MTQRVGSLKQIAALAAGMALLAGDGLIVPAEAATGVDATHYTVACDTVSKGAVQFKPPLTLGGALPTQTKIKGKLSGCTATPDDGNPPVAVLGGTVKGLLTASTNDCLSLLGPSDASGTITIKWKTDVALTSNTTLITVNLGNVSGGTASAFGDSAMYGFLGISGTSQTGPFGGPSGTGAASFVKALTVQGVNDLATQCSSTKGLKAVSVGPTELDLQ